VAGAHWFGGGDVENTGPRLRCGHRTVVFRENEIDSIASIFQMQSNNAFRRRDPVNDKGITQYSLEGTGCRFASCDVNEVSVGYGFKVVVGCSGKCCD
jgi:hypothetical protein